MRGLFESPLEVMAMQNPTLLEEELWDLPYPIDISLVDDIGESNHNGEAFKYQWKQNLQNFLKNKSHNLCVD